ncbi:MAG TPA: methyltransferase [Bacteroidota bacterium]|nr:methyltransferase [Bacteroidota bacterium]
MPDKSERSFSRDEIRANAYAFQQSRVLLTAYELGIFSAIDEERCTSAEIARKLGTEARATDRLLNALCAIELLTKKDGRFANTASARKYLSSKSPAYIPSLMHTVHLWDTWSALTNAVRTGRGAPIGAVNDRGDTWLTSFISAMHERASRQAPQVISQIDLSGITRVLDVGGGSGAYAMAFARARPSIRSTVFDLPSVVPITRRYIEMEGLAGRVSTSQGDYLRDELGEGYDLVFLSAIIHSNSPEENRQLMRKCARALTSPGRIVLQDFIMDDDRVHPSHGALFALNMLVGTDSGDTYTEAEVRQWLLEAGFADISRQETPFGTSQIIGVHH